MADPNLRKLHRNFLLIVQRAWQEGKAAELLTGLPRPLLQRIAELDIEQIEELSETMNVSLITLRLTEQSFNRLVRMPKETKGIYAEATILGSRSGTPPIP